MKKLKSHPFAFLFILLSLLIFSERTSFSMPCNKAVRAAQQIIYASKESHLIPTARGAIEVALEKAINRANNKKLSSSLQAKMNEACIEGNPATAKLAFNNLLQDTCAWAMSAVKEHIVKCRTEKLLIEPNNNGQYYVQREFTVYSKAQNIECKVSNAHLDKSDPRGFNATVELEITSVSPESFECGDKKMFKSSDIIN